MVQAVECDVHGRWFRLWRWCRSGAVVLEDCRAATMVFQVNIDIFIEYKDHPIWQFAMHYAWSTEARARTTLANVYMPFIVTATTETPIITTSPPINRSTHKPNDFALPIGLSDFALKPRGRPRKIPNPTPKTQTPTITSSPPKIHKPNDVALPIGLLDMALRPRGRSRKIENATHSTHTPIIAKATSLLATPKHTNVFASASEVSNITPGTVGRPRKFQHTTNSTHTPTIATTPLFLATPQHSNVVASSSGVSNILPRSVGRPRKFQKTTPTTQTPMVTMQQLLCETPQHTNVFGSSVGVSKNTPRRRGSAITKDFTLTSIPRPRGRPPKSDVWKSTTTETIANTSTPASLSVPHHTNIVESSTSLEGSTSGTHQQKGKSVRMKSSRRINFNDTDDEDEAKVESQTNRFEGISNESTVGNTHANSKSYSLYCGRGKVMLPKKLKNLLKLLTDLINKKHQKSTTFIDNIRRYNSMFMFTYMGGKQDKSVNTGRGPYCYRIQGMNCHRIGALLPDEGKPLIFSQLYIYDTENEIENRIKFSSNDESTSYGKKKIDHQLTTEIRDMLDINNPLRDGRKYNLPTASKVAALIVGDFDSTEHKRDIILEEQRGDLQ
ncbi:hypothetical protein Tco_0026882 [Tanacetum coccineum]